MQVVPAHEYLSEQERRELMQKSTRLAWYGILLHYSLIAATLTLAYLFPNPLTVVVALFVLGGQQLACAILMHDTAHYAVFPSKVWNDRIGKWLGAYPVFNNMLSYRRYHFKHHASNGLAADPDLLLTRGYPATRKSMFRKFFRDLSGQTGIKALIGLFMMHLGLIEFNLGGKVVKVSQKGRSWRDYLHDFRQNALGPLIANGILLAILWVLASPWLYLLWLGAYLTTFQFCLRVRSIAEHSVVEDAEDPYKNTRTTRANLLERLLFAPYHVNYHCEHHMLMAVPPYHLPKMHRLLQKRGFYEKGVLASGYWSVIQNAVVK